MSEALKELGAYIEARRSDNTVGWSIAFEELTVDLTLSGLVDTIDFLKSDAACRFTTLVDITAVDYPGRDKRFDVVYHFLSMYSNQRIRLRVAVDEDEMVPTLSEVPASANWYEREIFDMFGIVFASHPDMRRLLTDYGFQGFPLRKDFPTTGYTEVRYDEEQKKVIYEPVSLVQEYRQFDFMSPWEGAEYILPGDEKQEQP